VADPEAVLVPLAALGVTVGPDVPALAGLLADSTATGVLAALTTELVRLATVALAHGVMPEAHGQNVVVVLRRGEVAGLVLRDLDAVRVHRPWLAAAGLPDPGYVVDGRTPNTLAPDTPEGLLAWFQMLGVHVGLHPVALALGTATGLDEADGWRTIAAATRRCLDDLAGRDDLAAAVAVARRQLLERRDWPIKLVMGPLLARGADCGTSMPSAVGRARNPLLASGDRGRPG
jgi:siderophore synthetase component